MAKSNCRLVSFLYRGAMRKPAVSGDMYHTLFLHLNHRFAIGFKTLLMLSNMVIKSRMYTSVLCCFVWLDFGVIQLSIDFGTLNSCLFRQHY